MLFFEQFPSNRRSQEHNCREILLWEEKGLPFEAKGESGYIGLRPRKDQDFTGESTFSAKESERE